MRRLPVWMATLLALLGAAPAISAAEPTTPPSAAAKTRGKVVVVADVVPDETANAKLRAAVYETARARGFEPDTKADVVTAATNAGAMQAGSVSTDEAALIALRKELGATLLVRVAPEAGGKARVVVVTETATKQAVVDASDAPVTAAVGTLLDELGAKAAPAAAPTTAPVAEPPPGTAGVMTAAGPGRRGAQTEEEEPIGPEAIRQRWEARGGVRASYEVRVSVMGLMLPEVDFEDRNPQTGATEPGEATTYGIGGGVGVRLSMMYLPLSQPHKGGSVWGAFRLGAGIDGNVLYYRPPIGYNYNTSGGTVRSRDTEYDDQARLIGIIPMQIGFHVGFGKYRSDTIWRGTALGIAYSPAVIYELEIGKTVGDFEFNYGGIEASIDVVSIEANRTGSSDAQIRLAAMLLPRVRPELPWLLSAGIGVVWY